MRGGLCAAGLGERRDVVEGTGSAGKGWLDNGPLGLEFSSGRAADDDVKM